MLFDAFGGMDFDEEEISKPKREVCSACERPMSVCLCSSFPAELFDTACQVIILMHPLEVKRKIRTAALLKRLIKKCEIVVGRSIAPSIGRNKHITAALGDPKHTAYLFPGDGAVDLSNCAKAREQGLLPPSVKHLIVLDGTWNFTREMFNENKPFMRDVIQVQFTTGIGRSKDGRSEYLVRREPTANCVCTLEATVACLCALEPVLEQHRDTMLLPLQRMVKFQLDLGFPMEVVQQHLNGTAWREGETGEEGAVLKYSYRKRRYVMVAPKNNEEGNEDSKVKAPVPSSEAVSRLLSNLREYHSELQLAD